ncbi:MAG: hypothetical protein M3Q55_09905, partial [Acidobacteriota bacterium]|nr:hypothetical protein [Acidobacteriota bacterium]
MTRTLRTALALSVTLGVGAPALAQQPTPKPQDWLVNLPAVVLQQPAATEDGAVKTQEPASTVSTALDRKNTIQYLRPQDQRGMNIFETTKIAGA